MPQKYKLSVATSTETELFYSAINPERNQEVGCIGRLRADFGRGGKEFWATWEDSCAELKTQNFKDEFDSIINDFRDNGILKDFAAMSKYCRDNVQAKLSGSSDYHYGFKIKTDNYAYYLCCGTIQGDYNLHCYVYQRDRLEKCYPIDRDTLSSAPKRAITERLEENKKKAALQEAPTTRKPNQQEL